MESVLVTGANGQLGRALQQFTEGMDGYLFYYTDVDTLDICDKRQVSDFVRLHDIGTVINCAAYTAVDRAEDDAESCERINCKAVGLLGEIAASVDARVIHISTDYVFDGLGVRLSCKDDATGNKDAGSCIRPYRETDATNPVSVYGKTKLAGEQVLLAVCKQSVILRTAWLYSETGTNFMKTMLRLGAEREYVGVVADQYGTPTRAIDLAGAIKTILTAPRFIPGIYHYTNEGECTWYDFATKIMALAGLKCQVKPLATADYPTRAARPAYSVLDKTKIKNTYGLQIPAWEEALENQLRITNYELRNKNYEPTVH